MIGPALLAAVRAARQAALHHPVLLPAALEAVADQVDRLLDLTGETCAPLRQAGRRTAAILSQAQLSSGQRMWAISQLTEEAILVDRLERVLPCRDAQSRLIPLPRGLQPALPRHWLPQRAREVAGNRPFSVVQGGRA